MAKEKITKEELIQLKILAEKMLSTFVEEVEPPKKKRGRPKKVKEKVVEEEIPEVDEIVEEFPEEVDEQEFSRERGVECQVAPFQRVKNRPNKFVDLIKRPDIKREVESEVQQAKFIKDDVEIMPRGLRPSPLVQVRCTRCRKNFKVHEGLATPNFRCNYCARG